VVRLRAYTPGDLPLLTGANTPEMTAHLGGPEPDEKVADRHARFVAMTPEQGHVYVVESLAGEAVGTVVFWPHEWQGESVYEAGWSILPAHQGHGYASAAVVAMLEEARAEGRHRYVHAFPATTNGPSNGVCRKAGFTLLGEVDVEYPAGDRMHSNDWVYDLTP
jgi:RimJ/RimL family protein N-acetyltransferase